jgi:uncharacterized protein YijF (DUF1287 family)
VGSRSPEALGHQVDADHRRGAQVLRYAAGHLADRPEAEHRDAAAGRDARVLHRLPRGREHVGQVYETVVGWGLRAP